MYTHLYKYTYPQDLQICRLICVFGLFMFYQYWLFFGGANPVSPNLQDEEDRPGPGLVIQDVADTVISHNLYSQNFKSRVSNPMSKYIVNP